MDYQIMKPNYLPLFYLQISQPYKTTANTQFTQISFFMFLDSKRGDKTLPAVNEIRHNQTSYTTSCVMTGGQALSLAD